MSLPYVVKEVVWENQAEAATKVLTTELERTKVTVIEITTAGFSGTIDIRGKAHEISAFSNIPYIRQDQATLQTPSVAQIGHTTDTGVYRYVILGYWRRLQLVMTRSAGTITCGVAGSSDASVFPYLPTKLLANSGVTIGAVGIVAGGALEGLTFEGEELKVKTYAFSLGGVNFNDYSQIKMLMLYTEAKDGTPITLHHPDSSTNYRVPKNGVGGYTGVDKVFIAFQCCILLSSSATLVRFGMSDTADTTIDDQEVITVANGLSNIPSLENVVGFFTAGKYVTAETNLNTLRLKVGSVLYGIEVDA